MGQTLSQVEVARRDGLLNKSDTVSLDLLAAMYGFPRPSWIKHKYWRKATQVAAYGTRGTFQTLRAFVQAALTQFNVPFKFDHFTRYPPQQVVLVDGVPPEFAVPGGNLSMPPNQQGIVVTPKNSKLWNKLTNEIGPYKTTFQRAVLLQSQVDKKWRVHRIIHWQDKVGIFLAPTHTAYWRGFPNAEYPWESSPVPIGKTTPSINSYINEDVASVVGTWVDGKTGVTINNFKTTSDGYLLPFAFTERSSYIHYDYVYDSEFADWSHEKKKEHGKDKRMRNPVFIEPNTVRLHLWIDTKALFPDLRPVTYLIVGDKIYYNDGTSWPSSVVAEGGVRTPGQPYGGQILDDEFSDGNPYGGQDGKLGKAPDDKGGGPHPPYLFPGNVVPNAEADKFLLSLQKLLPAGGKIILTRAYGPPWDSTYDKSVPETGIKSGLS